MTSSSVTLALLLSAIAAVTTVGAALPPPGPQVQADRAGRQWPADEGASPLRGHGGDVRRLWRLRGTLSDPGAGPNRRPDQQGPSSTMR